MNWWQAKWLGGWLGLWWGGLTICAAGSVEVASDSPFGVVCPWPSLKGSGISWCRVGAGATALANWPDIQKSSNTWDWTAADRELKDQADPLELSLLPILGYTPKWASRKPEDPEAHSYPPEDIRYLSEFVCQCVRRYHARVNVWEVWNEPNIGFLRGSAADYAEMVKAAAVAARKEDPACRVAMGCAGVDIDYLQRLLEFGCGPYFDIASVHPYQWGREFNEGYMVDKLRSCRELLDRFGQTNKPIWITEMGWSLGEGVTASEQANLLSQAVVTALTVRETLRVEKVFWFCVKDWGGPGHGLFDVNGQPKPAFHAYRTVINELGGADYLGPWAGPKGVRGHAFLKAGQPVLALWTPSAHGKSRVELATAAQTLRCRKISNEASAVSVTGGKAGIEVSHAPVFIDGLSLNELAMSSARPTTPRATPAVRAALGDVWISVVSPPKTARPFFTLGGSNEFLLTVHNDGAAVARGHVDFELALTPGAPVIGRVTFEAAPGAVQTVVWQKVLPAGPVPSSDLAPLHIRAVADGRAVPPILLPVRLTGGSAIEFAANSWVEGPYLDHAEKSGCGDSIRFGSEFGYKFDLTGARSAEVRMVVGANGANAWSVLLSRDGREFVEACSGKSWPSWQKISLDKYVAPGERSVPVYVRIRGQDCQVREVVLKTDG
jgi:hypothetical protein